VGIDAVNGVQGAGIDDDSSLGLGLPQRGVSLPPHRHLYVVAVRKLDKCADVMDRAWTQHRYWRPLDDVPEVICRFRQGSRIHDELTVEIRDGDTVWMISMGRGDPGVVVGIKCQDSRPRSHANQEVPAPEASLHSRFPPQEVYRRARSCLTRTRRKILPVGTERHTISSIPCPLPSSSGSTAAYSQRRERLSGKGLAGCRNPWRAASHPRHTYCQRDKARAMPEA
jgi:hypothetical protein